MLWSYPAAAAAERNELGATVESVVAFARRLNPTVAAASLDFDAAVHKIGTMGVVADPTLILEHGTSTGRASVSAASVSIRRSSFGENTAWNATSPRSTRMPRNSRGARP